MLTVALLSAPQASASLEWPGPAEGEFPNSRSEVILESAPKGLAVNDGTGDLYEADGRNHRVLRFDKEGKFLEAWGWGVGDGLAQYERCGPDGEPQHPECLGRDTQGNGVPGTGEGQFEIAGGVAVDQTTGDVFVAGEGQPGLKAIQEFTATGQFIAGFAPIGEGGGEQVELPDSAGLAVDTSGRVYLVDNGTGHRVLQFEEEAGKYVFKRELFKGKFANGTYLSLDADQRFYLSADGKISRFDAATATSPSWQIAPPETEGTTVDPATGEVFFYSVKERKFHRIKPEGATGGEDEPFGGAGSETGASGAAYNPNASIKGHPAGVLYVDEPFDPATKQASRGLIFIPSNSFPPEAGSESVRRVGSTSATLEGRLNPRGFDTTYRFEYGTEPCSASPCTEAPAGGINVGAGVVPQPVSIALGGLSPGTKYFYRLVAQNRFGRTVGEDADFSTYPPVEVGPPDGRAYELVSPAQKHGGEVIPANPEVSSCHQCEPGINSIKMPEQSASDGETIAYEGFPFFPGSEAQRGALKENEYLSVRTRSGWQTEDLSLERETHGFGYRAFSPDLTGSVLQEKEAALAEGGLPDGYEELYRGEVGEGFSPLIRELLEPSPPFSLTLVYAGGSSDLAHLAFEANKTLTSLTAVAPAAPVVTGPEQDLYEWTEGSVRLVNVLPGNSKAAPGSAIGAGDALNATPAAAPDTSNAVSSDGAKIFWTDLGSGKLYLRENATATKEIQHPGKCEPAVSLSERVCFLTASADGSRVLLSNGSIFNTMGEPAVKIFDLTRGHGGFLGIAGASADLKTVYFVDEEVVTTAEGPEHAVAKAGQPNLYVYEADTGVVRFIATLQAFDGAHGVDAILGTWAPAPADRLAQVTPDGRFLAFDSTAALTGATTMSAAEHCGGSAEPKACSEVYEYDAQERSLTCVSCNPTGQPPVGPSWLSLLQPIVSRFPQPRNLTPSGRVFFDSFDALTASDGFPGVENVYEYERQGQGSCDSNEGCLGLISTGESLDSSFLSADESGKDVFFTTRQRVLPEQDRDELVDLYDAREGGGFASTVPPARCDGEEECRPPVSPPPGPPAGGSSTLVGPGNLSPQLNVAVKPATAEHPPRKRCRKGMVRNKHHKCVKVRHKKGKSAHKRSSRRGRAS